MKLASGMPVWLLVLPVLSLACVFFFILLFETYLLLYISAGILLLNFVLLLFFRDPERDISVGVTSPADGRVTTVEMRRGRYFISIFMNVHNVHVNRAPWNGTVVSIEHISGGYAPAFSKDSDRNERLVTRLATDSGMWTITQIAGAVARRIVPYIKEGDELLKGQRFGLIRFGSRVDLEFKLPRGMEVIVSPGDRVKAGSSSLAVLKKKVMIKSSRRPGSGGT
ncbi:MAG: phosphatidylserine decarboxylase [Candidatus Thermoplasmatota archaeon]|nr:phosphatidylserine decarboxylase [Candidatus Thermoplasmatota archaeon]